MKKNFIFTIVLLTMAFGFSQSTIVTIDRLNIIGPTQTGNVPEISSIGLTRGAGVELASAGAKNFTSSQWNGSSQAEELYLQSSPGGKLQGPCLLGGRSGAGRGPSQAHELR